MYAWNKNFHYKHWKKLRVYPHFGVSLVNFHYFRHRHVPSLSLSLGLEFQRPPSWRTVATVARTFRTGARSHMRPPCSRQGCSTRMVGFTMNSRHRNFPNRVKQSSGSPRRMSIFLFPSRQIFFDIFLDLRSSNSCRIFYVIFARNFFFFLRDGWRFIEWKI